MSKNAKSRTFSDRKQHLYRYRSSSTGTLGEKGGSGQHVPVQVEHVPVHPSSGQHVPVQVEHVPIHPSSEQPILIQVELLHVQVVPTALF